MHETNRETTKPVVQNWIYATLVRLRCAREIKVIIIIIIIYFFCFGRWLLAKELCVAEIAQYQYTTMMMTVL